MDIEKILNEVETVFSDAASDSDRPILTDDECDRLLKGLIDSAYKKFRWPIGTKADLEIKIPTEAHDVDTTVGKPEMPEDFDPRKVLEGFSVMLAEEAKGKTCCGVHMAETLRGSTELILETFKIERSVMIPIKNETFEALEGRLGK